MGKPSRRKTKNSNHSISTASTSSSSSSGSKGKMNNSQINLQKIEKRRKRKKKTYRKTNQNIKKLFNQLRSDSQTSITDSAGNTVIELDCTTPNNKRKSPEADTNQNIKRFKPNKNDSCIIIEDNNLTPRKTSTIQCSTPIVKKDKSSLHDLIVSNFEVPKQKTNLNTSQNFTEEVNELTKEINKDSYLTIDLTTETFNSSASKTFNTVIDLANNTDNDDCMLVSVSETNLSLSGESDVTVLHMNTEKNKKEKQMHRFAKGIAKMDSSEKGRLLELITQNIFSGCDVPRSVKDKIQSTLNKNNQESQETKATETVQDSYIKEVILGQTPSRSSLRNSIGSNIYNPEHDAKNKTGLRMIVIDGSNVAMEHGKGKVFSVRGLKICIDYFLNRGHIVKAFVPRFRCKFGKSSEPRLLDDLERRGLVVYTPSREIQGRMVTSYDDRYIVQCAAEFDGVIVSGDNYRDLLCENPRWRPVIENRLLPFTWVNDMIMFPRDPLGRNGPSLEQFLSHPETQKR